MIKRFFSTYYLCFVLAALCLILQFFELVPVLRYDRMSINDGELWRLLSANFVHLGWPHFWMNMGALGLMWLLFVKRLSTQEWQILILLNSLFVAVLLHFFNPELIKFVGFSGTLHGIMLAGCWREWKHDKVICVLAGALTLVKLGYEQIYGALPGSAESAGGPVVVDSHFYGAIGGVLMVWIFDGLQKIKHKTVKVKQQ